MIKKNLAGNSATCEAFFVFTKQKTLVKTKTGRLHSWKKLKLKKYFFSNLHFSKNDYVSIFRHIAIFINFKGENDYVSDFSYSLHSKVKSYKVRNSEIQKFRNSERNIPSYKVAVATKNQLKWTSGSWDIQFSKIEQSDWPRAFRL